ncbi:MAG: hypothetical protein R3F11_26890 [Verrucomicrobiales bacterium]
MRNRHLAATLVALAAGLASAAAGEGKLSDNPFVQIIPIDPGKGRKPVYVEVRTDHSGGILERIRQRVRVRPFKPQHDAGRSAERFRNRHREPVTMKLPKEGR